MLENFIMEIGDPEPWDQSHAANQARKSMGTVLLYTAVGRWEGKKIGTKGNVAREILSDNNIDLREIIQRKMAHWCEYNLDAKGA